MAHCLESSLEPGASLIHSIFLCSTFRIRCRTVSWPLHAQNHLPFLWSASIFVAVSLPNSSMSFAFCKPLSPWLTVMLHKSALRVLFHIAVMILFHQWKLGSNLQVIWTMQFTFFTLKSVYFSGWSILIGWNYFAVCGRRLWPHAFLFQYTAKFHQNNILS